MKRGDGNWSISITKGSPLVDIVRQKTYVPRNENEIPTKEGGQSILKVGEAVGLLLASVGSPGEKRLEWADSTSPNSKRHTAAMKEEWGLIATTKLKLILV